MKLTTDRVVSLLFLFTAILFLAPIGAIVVKSFAPLSLEASFLTESLKRTIPNTLYLCVGVSLFSSFFGLGAAFLQVFTNLKFKRLFHFLFILPLAMPLYVLSFIYVGMFEFSSPLMVFFRNSLGIELYDYLKIKSFIPMSFILSLGLFPYIYLICKQAFESINPQLFLAARSLGEGQRGVLKRVLFPCLAPWFLAGVLTVNMDILADFGAVSVFNYDTLTTSIYAAWNDLFSIELAARFSFVLVIFASILNFLEAKANKRKISFRNKESLYLFNEKSILPTILASSLVFVSTILPLIQIILWVGEKFSSLNIGSELKTFFNSSLIGIASGIVLVGAVLIFNIGIRLFPKSLGKRIIPLLQFGYSLPGNIIGVALYIIFIKTNLISFNSWFNYFLLLIIGLNYRFFAVAQRVIYLKFNAIPKQFDLAARSLGQGSISLIRRVHLPLISKSLLFAFVMIFLESMKEMPLTLMLRPFEFNTLSVRIYELTSEGEWELAALPAFFLILLGLAGVILMDRLRGDRNAEN